MYPFGQPEGQCSSAPLPSLSRSWLPRRESLQQHPGVRYSPLSNRRSSPMCCLPRSTHAPGFTLPYLVWLRPSVRCMFQRQAAVSTAPHAPACAVSYIRNSTCHAQEALAWEHGLFRMSAGSAQHVTFRPANSQLPLLRSAQNERCARSTSHQWHASSPFRPNGSPKPLALDLQVAAADTVCSRALATSHVPQVSLTHPGFTAKRLRQRARRVHVSVGHLRFLSMLLRCGRT